MSQASLPPLPYAYDGLEPYISKEIMELHHKKHHQTYVNGLNDALNKQANLQGGSFKELIALQAAIKFNGGGHINHSIFWENMAPAADQGKGIGGKLNPGPLKEAIDRDYGSLDALKKEFNATAATIQGSGWCWLGLNPKTKKLDILTTANQDPLTTHAVVAGLDCWEHAFYLQYKNVKPDYFAAWWHVVNFEDAEKRYKAGLEGAKL